MPRSKKQRPPSVPWPELGKGQAYRLKTTRYERLWSLRDLSAASGVSMRTIQAIEAGRGNASGEIMAALADALRVGRGWLMYGG